MEQYFLTDPEKLVLLVRTAAIHPNMRVLELGAGGGTVAEALPPCILTLVELDAGLAAGLRQRFPDATVLNEDALEVLERLEFDILLSNLPHSLTGGVLDRLHNKTFERALVAVHEDTQIAPSASLAVTPLLTLVETDFTPPQPFRSKLILVRPRLDL